MAEEGYLGNWWPTLEDDQPTSGKELVWNLRGTPSQMSSLQWHSKSFTVSVSGSLVIRQPEGSTAYHERAMPFAAEFNIDDTARDGITHILDLAPVQANQNRVLSISGPSDLALTNGSAEVQQFAADYEDGIPPGISAPSTLGFSASIEIALGSFTEGSLSPSNYLGVGIINTSSFATPLHVRILALGQVKQYTLSGSTVYDAFHSEASTVWGDAAPSDITQPDWDGPECGAVTINGTVGGWSINESFTMRQIVRYDPDAYTNPSGAVPAGSSWLSIEGVTVSIMPSVTIPA